MEETFGRYRLMERLGRGGMAEVFKAKSFGVEGFEKTLVIKRILPELAENPKFVEMFVREAKLAVRLSHANIVQVFDLGKVDGTSGTPSYYIAMEHVAGVDLATVLRDARRTGRPLPFGMAVYVAAEIAKGLDHAHRRRDEQSRPLAIVHRDVSPQNVLLSWEGEVKVTDFGIAKAQSEIDPAEQTDVRMGRLRGKLAYMSPEQSRGESVDFRADLFSLGVVLYEMIAGSNPFTANTAFETLRRVQASEYPPLELLRPDVPPSLAGIVAQLLAKEPALRPTDAGRVHELLLGELYASGARFHASDLSTFLQPLREIAPTESAPPLSSSSQSGADLLGARPSSDEVTPVEVPATSRRTATPTAATPARDSTPGRAEARAEAPNRREVTILVVTYFDADRTDVDGSSTHAFQARAVQIVSRLGGTVLESDGVQLLALFGLEGADGRDTEAAIRAALLVLRGRTGRMSVSAGVHAGRITVDGERPARDARFTDLVSAAQTLARACDQAVVLSPLAARLSRGAFETDAVPGPEGARRVVSGRRPESPEERFVGRQSELRRLGELLAQATRGGPLVVALHGPCGIGKSRVLSEMERRIRRAGFNVGFYQASCPVRGATEPLSALGTMLGTLCGVQEGDDASRLLDLVPRLRALGLRERERNAVLRHLGAPVPDAAQGDPTKEILQVAFTRMVQSLSEDRVQCFSWDDAQHFDPASLDILTSVAAREGLRATFVLATRELAPFEPLLDAAGARGARVELRELSEEESVRLIAHRLGGRTVPPELVAFCRERAGGQPLYLEELVRELGDSGAVSVLTGNIRARLDAVTTTVPRTLRTLVGARISRLPPAERALLQAASILGERAPVEVLAAVLGQTVVQVDRGAAGLAAKELLRAPNLATVEFTSPMHAEVIREDMTVEQRRELHARAAQAFAERGDELESAEGAAHHLTLAGERDAAATQWARAAVARARGGRLDLAVRCWLRAFELADFSTRGAPEIEAWLSGLATAVSRLRRAPGLVELLPAPLARLDALLGAAAGGGDPAGLPGRIRARVHVARALMGVNQFAATSQHVDEAKALLAGVADHALADELRRATLQIDLEASVRSGDNSRGVRAADQLEAMGIGGDPRLLLGVAGCRSVAGDPARALALIQQAEELARPDDLLLQYDIAKQRGLLGIQSMDYAAAVAASERAVELARTTGLAFDLGAALHNLGDACHRRGELPRAYAALTDSLEVTLEAGLERLASLNRLHLTYLDALRGDEKAEGLLRDLIRYAETRGFWTDVMQGRYLLGRALLRRGVRGPARVELTEVLTMAREYDDMAAEADARQALAELDERASAAPPG